MGGGGLRWAGGEESGEGLMGGVRYVMGAVFGFECSYSIGKLFWTVCSFVVM